MTTTTPALPLTADDLRAIKNADVICFQIRETGSSIRAQREYRDSETITPADRKRYPDFQYGWSWERSIPVTGGITGYYDYASKRSVSGTAFYMVHSAQYSKSWTTIAGLLKVGDEIYLDFVGDKFSSDNVKKTGQHLDALTIVVKRGAKRMEFLLGVSLCPDNSARMVKPSEYSLNV